MPIATTIGERPTITRVMARVVANEPVTPDGKILTLSLPPAFAESRPGQFVHLQVGTGLRPFLRRPFSILGHRPAEGGSILEIMYAVVGLATEQMAKLGPSAELDVLGPLGNGFQVDGYRTWIMVAGGRGAVPLYRLLETVTAPASTARPAETSAAPSPRGACPDIRFLFGARSRAHLWWLGRLDGVTHAIATDDGSYGRHATVVDLLRESLAGGFEDAVVLACGPEPMLAAVARTAEAFGVPAQVSLESRMGCACGLCRGCVIPRRPSAASPWPRDGNAHYGTVCKEGPVFLGREVDWEVIPEP